MEAGKRYYVILDQDTGECLEDSNPITGFIETVKFNTEKEAQEYISRDEELRAEYNDGRYTIISLRW